MDKRGRKLVALLVVAVFALRWVAVVFALRWVAVVFALRWVVVAFALRKPGHVGWWDLSRCDK